MMARKSGQMRFYAIHFPPRYKGVHYDYWENVQAMTQGNGAVYGAFDGQASANYFMIHGHLRSIKIEH